MKAPVITLRHVPHFEVRFRGHSLGVFSLEGEWNGMATLQRLNGGRVVIDREENWHEKFFAAMRSDQVAEARVFKATPEVLKLFSQFAEIPADSCDPRELPAEGEKGGAA